MTGSSVLGNRTTGLYVERGRAGLEAAAVAERLGYGAVWMAGGQLDTLDRIGALIVATDRVRVVPGIIAFGAHDDGSIAALYAEHAAAHPGRLVLGLGGPQEARPMAALAAHLNALDAAGVPRNRRLLAALGPKKTAVARDRAAGAITLLTDPGSTAQTRSALGDGSTLAVNVTAVLDSDPHRARAAIREPLEFLSQVGGYRASFRRMDFSEEEINALADSLVDTVAVWGDAERIADRVEEHRRAGADHVAVSLLGTSHSPSAAEGAGQLAAALSLAG